MGADDLVVLYYHVGDQYSIPEGSQRAGSYGVGGIPHCEFDAVQEVVGAGPTVINTYRPIVNGRLAVPSPIEIESYGSVAPDSRGTVSGFVTAKFKVTDTPPAGDLRAQFVVYEDVSVSYPYTVRDMLEPEVITTLNAPGDSIVFTKSFSGVENSTNDPTQMHVVVFIEVDSTTPVEIVNSQLMPNPYGFEFDASHYAEEFEFFGEAEYAVYCTNSGTEDDTYTFDFTTDFPGDPFEWVANYCDTDGICYIGPHDIFIPAGATETLYVHISDFAGTYQDIGTVAFTATGATSGVTHEAQFIGFCELTPILLVDDDGPMTYETYFQDAIEAAGYKPYTTSPYTEGRPTGSFINSFDAVFWTTASRTPTYLTSDDEASMAAYLDSGGNLCFASCNFLSSRSSTSPFVEDYLEITNWVDDNGGQPMVGVASDPISDGMSLPLSIPIPYWDGDPFTTTADVIFTSTTGNQGLRNEAGLGKVVFMSFPFEDVKFGDPDPNNSPTLVTRIMDWFMDSTDVDEPDDAFAKLTLEQNAPNPFNPITTIAFNVPAGAGDVELAVYSVNGRLVRTLVEGELDAGPQSVVWDGRDAAGDPVASGVYFARLTNGSESAAIKMALLK